MISRVSFRNVIIERQSTTMRHLDQLYLPSILLLHQRLDFRSIFFFFFQNLEQYRNTPNSHRSHRETFTVDKKDTEKDKKKRKKFKRYETPRTETRVGAPLIRYAPRTVTLDLHKGFAFSAADLSRQLQELDTLETFGGFQEQSRILRVRPVVSVRCTVSVARR